MRYVFLVVLFLLVLSVSGCTQEKGTIGNVTTEYEYYNISGNETIEVPKGDFTFKIYGVNELWVKQNKSLKFYVVFNNVDDDEKAHEFIARAHPSAVDFDVMAAYKCLYFKTCAKLLEDMESFLNQQKDQIKINYTYVGLYSIGITIPEDAVVGTYMYNIVACKDMDFEKCTETETNWGPNVPLTVHVL